ncbi:MAG: MBL fold metallo-hydrolase [Hyphomicrobiales bacterium]|nr:MBL fold metallo-hydrolase [Hyphomicrobiales bacterium]
MKPTIQPSGVSHIAIGDIVVSAINDGVFQASFDDLVTKDRAANESAHRSEFRLAPPWLTINCFLIQTGDRTVLVDSGFAGKTDQVGRAAENLKAINVAPADVDTIVMTHMHPDHEAGLTDASGKPIFPKAELILHENELAFWKDDGAMARATPEGQGDFHLARAALGAYGDRVRTVKTDEVAPGVRAFPTPGHTPGHTAWLVESNGEALLIWGDIVHFPGMQFAFPDTSVAYDIDPAAAAEARKKVLKFAAGEKLRVAGVHLDFPTFGHVVPNGAAYRFVPEVWRPTL